MLNAVGLLTSFNSQFFLRESGFFIDWVEAATLPQSNLAVNSDVLVTSKIPAGYN